MLKMTDQTEDPSRTTTTSYNEQQEVVETQDISQRNNNSGNSPITESQEKIGLISWIRGGFKSKPDPSLRETLEEYIDEKNLSDNTEEDSISAHEKTLISNVLKLRGTTVFDVMIPRVDIMAIDDTTTQKELLQFLAEKQFSRIPVYKEKLDDVLGTIHIKDVLACLAQGQTIDLKNLVRDVPIISPSMPVLDLLLEMRATRRHMSLVVDEYGGIDGLVTIGDIIEEIVGQIEDEHDSDEQPQMITQNDGSIIADARVNLDEFEEKFGALLNDEERVENDTLGGLMFHLAGRVPARGEVLSHPSGLSFEITEADPRRVAKLRISRNS